jgi:hypothetical protein
MTSLPSTSGSSNFIVLPELDGYLEAGIAAGVDGALPDADKFPVFGSSSDEVFNNALPWALAKDFKSSAANDLFISGMAVVSGGGFLRTKTSDGIPDGDWYEASSGSSGDIPDSEIPRIKALVIGEPLRTAVTVICATKVNFWLMNHHVGQTGERNVAAGYVQKVLTLKFDSPPPRFSKHDLGTRISTE